VKMSRIGKYFTALMLGFGLLGAAYTSGAQKKPPKKYTDTVTAKNGDKISFDMVLIPSGDFVMGSPAGEADRQKNEYPQHKVKLDSYYLCTTETTIALYRAFYQETVTAKKDFDEVETAQKEEEKKITKADAISGPTAVYGDMTMGYDENHPAIGLTWHNATVFCKWLSLKTGKTYRLPTEAEWEYACRAGTKDTFYFGNDIKQLKEYAWYIDSADGETNPVAQKKPNSWGLYDMLGNVREWVSDFYSPTAYQEAAKKNPAVNPQGAKEGDVHVARGGDYYSEAKELRCAARSFEQPFWRDGDPQIPKSKWWLPEMDIIGFRVALSLPKTNK
jgi:formylglycine-generating enzyme required for sulfatase activity